MDWPKRRQSASFRETKAENNCGKKGWPLHESRVNRKCHNTPFVMGSVSSALGITLKWTYRLTGRKTSTTSQMHQTIVMFFFFKWWKQKDIVLFSTSSINLLNVFNAYCYHFKCCMVFCSKSVDERLPQLLEVLITWNYVLKILCVCRISFEEVEIKHPGRSGRGKGGGGGLSRDFNMGDGLISNTWPNPTVSVIKSCLDSHGEQVVTQMLSCHSWHSLYHKRAVD